jgi:hypothetical protein
MAPAALPVHIPTCSSTSSRPSVSLLSVRLTGSGEESREMGPALQGVGVPRFGSANRHRSRSRAASRSGMRAGCRRMALSVTPEPW